MKKDKFLKQYENYTNEELISYAIDGINHYSVIEKSEMIAKRLLEAYGINFYYMHENFKSNIRRLMMCLKMRGLNLPENAYLNDITTEDIIERISENEAFQESLCKDYDFKGISSLYEAIINKCQNIMDEGKIFR